MKKIIWVFVVGISLATSVAIYVAGWESLAILLFPVFLLIAVSLADFLQIRDPIRRNFPILGHLRNFSQWIRPQIYQYFVESDTNGKPFSREARYLVYQRAAGAPSNRVFGTQADVYLPGFSWINHSMVPKKALANEPRIQIGGQDGGSVYLASVFNISAMGAVLSNNAILALTNGAKLGGFFHNTGETGIMQAHIEPGGDLVWQIGPQYIHCRSEEGEFNDEKFQELSQIPNVKMIELKLSQGARAGYGRTIPGSFITPQVASTLRIPAGKDLKVPSAHPTFSTPRELLSFLKHLKKLSGGKPVGIKLCVGSQSDFFGLAKAMLEENFVPDFINIDGSEGGSANAPAEFADSVGTPLKEGIVFVHNVLTGFGLRQSTKIMASGKIISAFDIASCIALGADICSSARGMMFALGCVQALKCHANTCPTGVATNSKFLSRGLHVGDKSTKVLNYHKNTIRSFLELIAAAGLDHPNQLRPKHIYQRVSPNVVKSYEELYDFVEDRSFLSGKIPDSYQKAWQESSPNHF